MFFIGDDVLLARLAVTAWRSCALCFCAGMDFSYLCLPPNFGGIRSDLHQTLPQCTVVPVIYKIRSVIWGSSLTDLAAQKQQVFMVILDNIATRLRI